MEELTEKEKKCCRYLANEMSKEDRLIFEIELTIDDELQLIYRDYQKIWSLYPTLLEEPNPQSSRKRLKRLSFKKIYFLSALLILAIWAGSSSIFSIDPVPYTHLKTTDKGQGEHFILPDSSRVTLNAESSLKFKKHFSKPREVWLDGEAFFEIKEDASNPFIVHTNDIEVHVKGTSFGVNTSSVKQTVSLETGSVSVLLKNNNTEVDLLPNEQLIWNSLTNEVVRTNFDPHNVLAWKEDILVLDDIRFSEAISKINSFYGVVFNIEGNSIKSQHITGVFKDQNLEEFIAALEFITNVEIIKESSQQYTIIASDEN